MIKKLAYKIVYKDLMKNELFTGKYDAVHDDPSWMLAMSIVLDFIAYYAGKAEEFSEMFYENMEKSENNVE